MDPTENRADLDALAARYPELVSVVNMPEKTSGYQRKSQAIMSGSNAIGTAPAAQTGAALLDTTGEITAAAPIWKQTFAVTAGQTPADDDRRRPVGLDRPHPDPQGPERRRR